MDGISAAASVKALVTLTLQSSGFIYRFLNTIRDAPEQIRDLGRRVDGLHQSLIQIADLIQLAGSLPASGHLRSSLFTCASDLQGIQAKISKLKASKDNSVRKAWSALKHVLGSQDLEHAGRVVSRHLHELHLQLNIIGRRGHIDNDKLTRNIKDIAEEESQSWRDLFNTATAKIEGLTSASDAQLSEMTKMLREIQLQLSSKADAGMHETMSTLVPGSSQRGSFPKQDSKPFSEPDRLSEETLDRPLGTENKLKNETAVLGGAINRLCRLVSLKPGKVATEEAENIIDDLGTISTMIQRQDRLLAPAESRGTKRKANSSHRRTERIPSETNDELDSEQIIEIFEGNISLLVPKGPLAMKLTIYFEQMVTPRGTNMLHPEISFHCIRPLNSAIFQIAARGTLAELFALLQACEASLNDCDEFGRSILNSKLSATIHIERMYRPLLGLYEKLSKPGLEEWLRKTDCQRLLLEAGADPNIRSEGSSPFLEIASSGTLAALRLMLDACPYIDTEDRDNEGRTALMLLFLHAQRPKKHASREDVYNMAVILLDHGADVNAYHIHGRGCVGMACDATRAFRDIGKEGLEQMQRLLVLLIYRGYDTYGTNNRGITVCEILLASNIAELWFEALRTSKFHYTSSAVLAEDHDRYHQRTAANIHYSGEISHDGQSIPTKLESRDTLEGETVTGFSLTTCADQVCQWLAWKDVKIIATRRDPDGSSYVFHKWYMRTHDALNTIFRYYVGGEAIITRYISRKDDDAKQLEEYKTLMEEVLLGLDKTQDQQDMSDEGELSSEEEEEQEIIYYSNEDDSWFLSSKNTPLLHATDSRHRAALMAGQQRYRRVADPACFNFSAGTEKQNSFDDASIAEDDIGDNTILQDQPA